MPEEVPNPLTGRRLGELCRELAVKGPGKPVISLTGGEPLLHADFLRQWLPSVRSEFTVYLETSGIHAEEMLLLGSLVDIVSMDIKMPSATGLRDFWQEHRAFLTASRGCRVFVKAVVTRDTREADVYAAADLVAEAGRSVPFVLQPASGCFAPPASVVMQLQEHLLGVLEDVRVIPQVHVLMGVP